MDWIIPSIPLSPKPPGTMIPDTSPRNSSTFSAVTFSESTHFMFTDTPLAIPPCFKDSTTLIYASWSCVYFPTSATDTSPFGCLSAVHIAFQSERFGSGHGSPRHSQATCAKCSSSIARGASYRYSTSRFWRTCELGTLQKRAILSLIPLSSGYSERHTMISGWIPIPWSSLTLACVGLVFISPEDLR